MLAAPFSGLGETVDLTIGAASPSRKHADHYALILESFQVSPLNRRDMVTEDDRGAGARPFFQPKSGALSTFTKKVEELTSDPP